MTAAPIIVRYKDIALDRLTPAGLAQASRALVSLLSEDAKTLTDRALRAAIVDAMTQEHRARNEARVSRGRMRG